MSCGVGCRCCASDSVLLRLWCRPAAVALIGPLAWEPPCAVGEALKSKKQTKQNKTNKQTPPQKKNSRIFFQFFFFYSIYGSYNDQYITRHYVTLSMYNLELSNDHQIKQHFAIRSYSKLFLLKNPANLYLSPHVIYIDNIDNKTKFCIIR